jgi:hypothetical protein
MIGLLLTCCQTKNKPEISTEILDFNAQAEVHQVIGKVALSFYDWYMLALVDTTKLSCSPNIVEGKNGKCAFDFYDYFDDLRKLGTVSEKFIHSEKERYQECEAHMKTIDYREYLSADAYSYQEYCSEGYYMYWIRSQETYSGVEVEKTEEKEGHWEVKLVFYNIFNGKKEYFRSFQPIVTIHQEGSKWKITQINWAD